MKIITIFFKSPITILVIVIQEFKKTGILHI